MKSSGGRIILSPIYDGGGAQQHRDAFLHGNLPMSVERWVGDAIAAFINHVGHSKSKAPFAAVFWPKGGWIVLVRTERKAGGSSGEGGEFSEVLHILYC